MIFKIYQGFYKTALDAVKSSKKCKLVAYEIINLIVYRN
jgi:hypothetical protein